MIRPARAVWPTACAAALAAAGCGGSGGGGLPLAAPATTRSTPTTTVKSAPSLTTKAGPPADPPLAVAQLFAVGFAGSSPGAPIVRALDRRDWGVVVLSPGNVRSLAGAGALVRALHRHGQAGGRPRPLVAARAGAVPGAPAVPQPEQSSPRSARRVAAAAATLLRRVGVRAVLAPDADLGVPAGPEAGTAFSQDPAKVSALAPAAVRGYAAGGVAAIPGHFPGQGSASQDPEQGVGNVGSPLSLLRQTDLRPFVALARPAPAMQLSDALYAAFDGVTPASLAPQAYRLLRSLGFRGLAMSGDLVAATAATGGNVGQAAVAALRAGADLLFVPGDATAQEQAYQAVLAAVRRGAIPLARLNDALFHVAAFKRAYGG